ncbi:hypothetical protein Tco_0358403 [Tanacetum coccineum]
MNMTGHSQVLKLLLMVLSYDQIVTVNESVKRRKKGGRVRKCLGPSALVVADDDTKRVNVNVNHQVSLAIRQLLFIVGVSLGAVNSVYFQPMIDAISAQGLGVTRPTYHDMR